MTEQTEKFAYDEVLYPTSVSWAVSVDRIRAVALMCGYQPKPAATASYLEIGCGDGMNVLSSAMMAPGGHAEGFDLSAVAVANGQAMLKASGMANADLHQGNIVTYPRDGRKFDFIATHGVHSWVPPFVASSLLELIAARLADGGVAYVSFDCLPASAAKLALHRFLQRCLEGVTDPAERIQRAYQIIPVLNANQMEGSRLAPMLREVTARLGDFNAGYFYHDHLAEMYHPSSVKDFAADAARYGLKIIGDAGLADMDRGGLDAGGQALLDQVKGDKAAELETFDMLRGVMMFRRAILVRSDAPPPAVKDLGELSFAFSGKRTVEGDVVHFTVDDESRIRLADPDRVAVMDVLHAASPNEVPISEIAARSGRPAGFVRELLIKAAAFAVAYPHGSPQPFVVVPGERPIIPPLVRALIERGEWTVNLRQTRFQVPVEPTRKFMSLCDGTRTREDLAAAMSVHLGDEVGLEMIESVIAELGGRRVFAA